MTLQQWQPTNPADILIKVKQHLLLWFARQSKISAVCIEAATTTTTTTTTPTTTSRVTGGNMEYWSKIIFKFKSLKLRLTWRGFPPLISASAPCWSPGWVLISWTAVFLYRLPPEGRSPERMIMLSGIRFRIERNLLDLVTKGRRNPENAPKYRIGRSFTKFENSHWIQKWSAPIARGYAPPHELSQKSIREWSQIQ